VLLLHYCDEVHLYEMIPSLRGRGRRPCHYYAYVKPEALQDDSNCTFINGHQRETEVATFMRLNTASDFDVFANGHAVVPGISQFHCVPNNRREYIGDHRDEPFEREMAISKSQ
jgi:hypothetical protein